MVRKAASEGRSLFCEWAVGSSINSAMRKLEKERLQREEEEAQRKRDVIRVELTTDDESERDSVRVTYPRNGAKGHSKGAKQALTGGKQVRFEQEPLKPSLKKKKARKKRAYESSGSEAIASDTESETDTRRGRSRKSRQKMRPSSGDSDAVYDSNCSDCERDLAKKKRRAKERRSGYKASSDAESSTGSERAGRRTKDEKRRRSRERRSGSHKNVLVDVDSDSGIPGRSDKKSRRGKENNKHRSKGESPERGKPGGSSKARISALSTEQKMYPEAMPGPHPRRPNLIRPIRAEVMQVEHTVEGPEDPRPNAFVDERHNIVRIYHGAAYGNPLGSLYPRRDPSLQPLPVGIPHPFDNPYYHGFKSQQQNHHMPTTLGDPYSSITMNTPIPSGPGHGTQGQKANDLTSGLWGLDSPNATKGKTLWSKNVGPKPSASLREANPNSRWGYGTSNKGNRKDGGDGNAQDDWGKTSNSEWGVAGNNNTSAGGNDGNWNSAPGNDTDDWNTSGGAHDGNGASAVDNWNAEDNNGTAGGNDTWATGNQDSTWSNEKNAVDISNNQSSGRWNSNDNNDTNWGDNTRNDETAWGATGDNSSWDASNKSGSNNVGPVGMPPGEQDHRSLSKHHVPGQWGEPSPQGSFPSWGDPTAAQNRNW